jgi:hypothetical protein
MSKSFIEFTRQSDANSVPAAGPGGLAVRARAQPDETTFPQTRSRPETEAAYATRDQRRGSIMLIRILNAIYRQFLRAALIGTAAMGGRP